MTAMNKDLFTTPVFIYLVLSGVSAVSAIVFFHLGGSLAELTGQTDYGFSFRAGGALAGFLLVIWVSVQVIERLYGIKSLSALSSEAQSNLPKSYSFPTLMAEISQTVQKLEADNLHLTKFYVARQDGNRLFDGIYSSLLYASGAAVTGQVDPRFYGNLMEWDSIKRQLRVKFFAGPYNDEIITRSFPIEGPGQGVASDAFNTQQIQVKNRMESELKEKGEARLNAMICVPVENIDRDLKSRQIVILNIDTGIGNAFPVAEEWEASDVKNRIGQVARLIARVNALYRASIENA